MLRILFFILIFIPLTTFGQVKEEKEYRVKAAEVPSLARDWLKDAFEGRKKVKWFREETSGKASYEAKFLWEKESISVEFDRDGMVEDIEIQKEFGDLPEELTSALRSFFNQEYQNWRIEKIQLQYSGSPDDLEDLVDEDEAEGILARYEIEFYGETAEDKNLWEGIFDPQGKMLSKRKVILPSTDNLFF